MLACAAALALTVLSACSPEVPAHPTYSNDVAPILDAHCVRCHGQGGTLNKYGIPVNGTDHPPKVCYLQRYDDDCSSGSCLSGAKTCVSLIVADVNMPVTSGLRMPPPPSDPLNDWEKGVIANWAKTDPPAP